MQKQKIFIVLFISGIIYMVVNISMDKKRISGNFTHKEIKQIQPGMDIEEVENRLGTPFEITSLAGLHKSNCANHNEPLNRKVNEHSNIREIVNVKFSETDYCCESNKDDLKNKRVTLIYSEPVVFSNHYPMLWVHLDSNFQVKSVFAKRYDGLLGLDDPCIYSLNRKRKFEDEELFTKSFN